MTAFSIGTPGLGYGGRHLPFDALGRGTPDPGANPLDDLKSRLALGYQTFVNLDRYHGRHRTSGPFHDDLLAPIADAADEVGEPISRFSRADTTRHDPLPPGAVYQK
jgi:hypothetical protein